MATAGLVDDARPDSKLSRAATEPYTAEAIAAEEAYDKEQRFILAAAAAEDDATRPLPLPLPTAPMPPPLPVLRPEQHPTSSRSKGKGRALAARPPGSLGSSLGGSLGRAGSRNSLSPRGGDDASGGGFGGSGEDDAPTGLSERANSLMNWARVPTFWGSEQVRTLK